MCHRHVSCSLKISTWYTPTVMFPKPRYSSWEPFSSFAATLGQLHCQKVAAAQPEFPHSLLSKHLPRIVMKRFVNVVSGCEKSGPHFQYYTREKKGNSLGKPPKKGVWALSNCKDTNCEFFRHNALGNSRFLSPRASLSAVILLWHLTLKQRSHEWHRSLQPLTWTLSLCNLCAIASLFLQAFLRPL